MQTSENRKTPKTEMDSPDYTGRRNDTFPYITMRTSTLNSRNNRTPLTKKKNRGGGREKLFLCGIIIGGLHCTRAKTDNPQNFTTFILSVVFFLPGKIQRFIHDPSHVILLAFKNWCLVTISISHLWGESKYPPCSRNRLPVTLLFPPQLKMSSKNV